MVRQSYSLQSGLPIFPVPTWHHTYLLEYCWLYSLCYILHPYDYFVTTNLYFLIPSPFPLVPSPLPLWQPSVYVYEFVSILFIHLFCSLDFIYIYIWNHAELVFLWMTFSLSIIPSKTIHAVASVKLTSVE